MSGEFDFRPIQCPTCEVDDTRQLGHRGGSAHRDGVGLKTTIVQCRRCGLIFPNPFPFPHDLDALYSNSEQFFDAHPALHAQAKEREKLIARFEPLVTGRRMLDVGSGMGESVAAALNRGWDAYGIEASARFVEASRALCPPERIFHGTIENAPAAVLSKPFDAVVLAAVIEHLHEPSVVLGAISRVLRPGGILFVDVPNDASLYTFVGNLWQRVQGRDWVIHLSPTFSPYHVFAFSRRSLTAMLRRHSLEPEEWKFYPGVSVLPFRKSVRGVLESVGSRLVHDLAKFGELGTYLECFARRI